MPAQQQRDRDLTGSDEFLTDEKLDSLWEWFCDMANEDKFQSQLIFAKLVNAARKPYRDSLSLRVSDGLFTPGTFSYTSSECRVTAGCIEGQQHAEQSEDKVTMEVLSTRLAIADDSVQTKQTIIKNLEDSLQTKQTMIKHLEDSLQTKQTIINQLEVRAKGMEQELEESKLRYKAEKKQLELGLKEVQQEYLEYREKGEGEKMQLELNLNDMYQRQQVYQQMVENEKALLELKLRNDNRTIDIEKSQLRMSLQVLQAEHEKCGLRFVLRSEQYRTFIGFHNGRAIASSLLFGTMIFKLQKHPTDMVSFRANTHPTTYLTKRCFGFMKMEREGITSSL
ncbi:hypothetical protein BDZ91DRAFT_795878 [Kalaharituber pfeilii]|nr:hypothetical protein BDZ91DRAFT_795878 [Kalaharituber pfeilii]